NYSDTDVQAAKEHHKSAGFVEEIKVHIWITHLKEDNKIKIRKTNYTDSRQLCADDNANYSVLSNYTEQIDLVHKNL
ncbi:hypothetical protein, partial [Brucella melitensis]|uniref:hypothetical protein n=1 Tax=Brucella melitensis TaxID=29459 RepID=UPI003B680625